MTDEPSFATVRPRRLLEWREEDGRCVLLRPRLGSSRLARWVAGLGGDPYYRIRLDEVGTLIWKACDGQTALADIVARMRKRFGDQVEPADRRLAQFVRKMVKGRMITVDHPEETGDRRQETGGAGGLRRL
ncbi:MAG: PqqD family protein [Acidobacteria bacterium]|jgi:hypothetical protein|nr:PqqD family protein [Acidobacteriota bacterium]MDP7480873.1 PqqD family protein [Vicinamibacterales bacterium]HJN46695.1 PqqD family protein [Vicinamibacterales bacterium]|tara:strand:- start:145 stop:537 length:393 start_codon:yes stop_codon:yes gene_type:complete